MYSAKNIVKRKRLLEHAGIRVRVRLRGCCSNDNYQRERTSTYMTLSCLLLSFALKHDQMHIF